MTAPARSVLVAALLCSSVGPELLQAAYDHELAAADLCSTCSLKMRVTTV
jgi:hypothetical protein